MPETIGAASIAVLISGSIWQQLTISTQDPAVERLLGVTVLPLANIVTERSLTRPPGRQECLYSAQQ
jgi:hypothetical protein